MPTTSERIANMNEHDQESLDIREYEICQQRGHQSDGRMYPSNPPKQRCKWCGTFYWSETISREGAAP